MKRVAVKIGGRWRRVPKNVVLRGGTAKWIKRKMQKLRKESETFGKKIKREMAQGIKDSAYGPEKPKRWNQKR